MKQVSSKGVEIPEEFRQVPGVPDRWVSRDGRVLNSYGRELLGKANYTGQPYMAAMVDGKRKTPALYELVCRVYLPKPDGDYRINYRSGNPSDVSVNNLEWVRTKSQIHKDRVAKIAAGKPGLEFKPIPGFEGFYASVEGRICDEYGQIVPCSINKFNYTQHSLSGVCEGTHRLVAMTFHPNPENKPQVNHINSLPWDNHADNLEWCTAQENMTHAWEHSRTTFAEGHWNAKLTKDQVLRIQELAGTGLNDRQITDQLNSEGINVTRSHVYHITSTTSWGRVKPRQNLIRRRYKTKSKA